MVSPSPAEDLPAISPVGGRESRANPSLKAKFPASSELTGISRRSGLSGARDAPELAFRSMLYRLVPYASEQGNLWGLAGN